MNSLRMLALGVLLNGTSAFAAEPIHGFGDYMFGMSFQDVNDKLTLSEEKSENDQDRVYGAEELIEVLGDSYTMTFAFQDNFLRRIHLGREYEAGAIACISDFDRVFASVQARYGSPDTQPDKSDPNSMSVQFTASDGSAVSVFGASFDLLEKCFLFVTYLSGKSGATF